MAANCMKHLEKLVNLLQINSIYHQKALLNIYKSRNASKEKQYDSIRSIDIIEEHHLDEVYYAQYSVSFFSGFIYWFRMMLTRINHWQKINIMMHVLHPYGITGGYQKEILQSNRRKVFFKVKMEWITVTSKYIMPESEIN